MLLIVAKIGEVGRLAKPRRKVKNYTNTMRLRGSASHDAGWILCFISHLVKRALFNRNHRKHSKSLEDSENFKRFRNGKH